MNRQKRIFKGSLPAALLGCVASIMSSVWSETTEGKTTNSAEIVSKTANLSCINLEPVGVCVWLKCSWRCRVKTSIKWKHFIADAVVSAYANTGENPWQEVRALSPATSLSQSGGANTGSDASENTSMRFKNVDVIGSPAAYLFDQLAQSSRGIYCRPGIKAYRPFFLSSLDPFWRDPLIETPLTLANAFRSVRSGSVGTYFGSIYPRIGFINQSHDFKAAAVTAQRAADIVTRKKQVHVYRPMLAKRRAGYWPPGAVTEGKNGSHRWQQLASGSPGCVVWPDVDDLKTAATDPYANRQNGATGNAFHLWRPYRCCKRKGQVFITHIDYKK